MSSVGYHSESKKISEMYENDKSSYRLSKKLMNDSDKKSFKWQPCFHCHFWPFDTESRIVCFFVTILLNVVLLFCYFMYYLIWHKITLMFDIF